jgi:hypothetical protein
MNIYIFIYVYIFPNMRLLEETKEGGKEGKNDRVNDTEIHCICVGTRQQNILKTVEQCKGKSVRRSNRGVRLIKVQYIYR